MFNVFKLIRISAFSVIFGFAQFSYVSAQQNSLGFEYISDEFSDDLISFVRRYSTRAEVEVRIPVNTKELAFQTCGTASSSNIRLFEESLTEQGVDLTEKGSANSTLTPTTEKRTKIWVPSCLPSHSRNFQLVGRLAKPGVYWEDYYKADIGEAGVRMALGNSHAPKSKNRFLLPNVRTMRLDCSNHFLCTYGSYPFLFSQWKWKEATEVEPSELRGNIQKFAQRLRMDGYEDESEIAFQAYGAIQSLLNSGIEFHLAKKQLVEVFVETFPELRKGNFSKRMDVARAVNDGSFKTKMGLAERSQIQNAVTHYGSTGFPVEQDYYRIIRDLNPIWNTLGMNILGAETPILSIRPKSLTASIPLDISRLPKDFELKKPNIYGGAQLRNFDAEPINFEQEKIVAFEAVSGCQSARAYDNWNTDSFKREFAEGLLRTRRASLESYGPKMFESDPTVVKVLDFGFEAQLLGRPPFFGDSFVQVGEVLKRQSPNSNFVTEHDYHGTAVLGLAMGGPLYWDLAPALGIEIKFSTNKIYRTYKPLGQDQPSVRVEMVKIQRGLSEGDANFVNLAFGARGEATFGGTPFTKHLGPGRPLLIIAAGNNNLNDSGSGVDLAGKDIFPQEFARDSEKRQNMLLVSSYTMTPDGFEIADFSNGHREWVEIAAPGCQLESYKVNQDGSLSESTFSGTSFSAPIVTYVAAIVHSLMNPSIRSEQSVKERILASSDLSETIARSGRVQDGRILNPLKAISLYHDWVEYHNSDTGEKVTLIGKFYPRPRGADLCNNFQGVNKPTILKFAKNPNTQFPQEKIMYWKVLDTFEAEHCDPTDQELIFFPHLAGEPVRIGVSSIQDLVLAFDSGD